MNDQRLSPLEACTEDQLAAILDNLIEYVGQNIKPTPPKKKVLAKDISKHLHISESALSRARKIDSDTKPGLRIIFINAILKKYGLQRTGQESFASSKLMDDQMLQALAMKLALNLIDVSTSFGERNRPHKKIIQPSLLEKARRDDETRERFIVVTGAGASHAATDGLMPLSWEAAQIISNKIRASSSIKKLIDKELSRLHLIYKMDKDNFETRLLATNKFAPDVVQKGLKELCNVEHTTSLVYEILAHMFKHRFVDAIINFNFDEILDTAIEEEMAGGEYKNIYFDGHCPVDFNELLIDSRLKQPIYIKPHGTISHLSSLRFTREDYFAMPENILNTIRELLSGNVQHVEYQKKLTINLIVLGFSMQSFEFTEILREYATNKENPVLNIWFFDTKNSIEEFELDLPRDRIKCHLFKIGENHNLMDYMLTLWDLIFDAFKPEYQPIGLERHLLVNYIFGNSEYKIRQREISYAKSEEAAKKEQINYFEDRLLVELVISFLKSDGLLNAKQIIAGRAGKYLRLREKSGQKNKSLIEHCQKIGLKVYKDFVWDTFIIDSINDLKDNGLYQFFYEKLKDEISFSNKSPLDSEEGKTLFLDYARKINKTNLLKVNPVYTHPHFHIFSRVEKDDIMNTGLAWIYNYRQVLEDENKSWDLLLSISEKGRFLPRSKETKQQFFKGKKLELVLSSLDMPDLTDYDEKRFEDLTFLSGRPWLLPWWVHNRHMVLFLKRLDAGNSDWRKNWLLYKGFYYQSRMLSRRVNPVRIKDKKDLEVLLYTYANYWHRAKAYTNSPPDQRFIPIISYKDEMDKHIVSLLDLYDKAP